MRAANVEDEANMEVFSSGRKAHFSGSFFIVHGSFFIFHFSSRLAVAASTYVM
jgi:hypothetical protein